MNKRPNRTGWMKKARWRWIRLIRPAAAVFLVVTAALLSASPVQAHASLVRSEPADGASLSSSPNELRLWFDEPISPRFSTVQIFDVNNQPIAISNLHTDPKDSSLLILSVSELPEGLYSVLFRTLSETDGHTSQGLLVFGVGDAVKPEYSQSLQVPPPSLAEVFLRFLYFLSIASIVGAVVVSQLVLSPIPSVEVRDTFQRAQRRTLSFARWCSLILLATGIGLLAMQTFALRQNLPAEATFVSTVWQILTRTRWGHLWAIRQAADFLLFTALVKVKRNSQNQPQVHHPFQLRWVNVLIVILLIAQSLSGHAAGLESNTQLAITMDILHLLAASIWVGGLLGLAAGLIPELTKGSSDKKMLLRAGWRPFSRLAVLSVGTLAATGIYSLGRQVASLDALLTTPYGRALLGKSGLVLGAGAVGLLNSMLLHPQLAAVAGRLLRRPQGWKPFSLDRLPRLLVVEGLLGTAVILLTGLVTASAAPRSTAVIEGSAEAPGALSQSVDDLIITFGAKPNRPGQNVFTVFAASTRKPPPTDIGRVIIRFEHQDQETGRLSILAEELEPGRYVVGGSYLSLVGHWNVDVVVRRLGMEDSVAHFEWVVPAAEEPRSTLFSSAPIEYPLTRFATALLLLTTGVAFVFLRARLPGVRVIQKDPAPGMDGSVDSHKPKHVRHMIPQTHQETQP